MDKNCETCQRFNKRTKKCEVMKKIDKGLLGMDR